MRELQRQASPGIVIALVGNKSDLANRRAVEFNEAKSYADDNNLVFKETSAKTAANVAEVFTEIATKLPHTDGSSKFVQGGGIIKPKEKEQQDEPKKKCC